MQVFNSLLVCLDLSQRETPGTLELGPPARKVVQTALWLARELSAELTFFSVLGSSGWGFGRSDARAATEAQRLLSGLIGQAQESNLPARSLLAEGTVWAEILKQLLSEHHDLVLLGTPHMSGLTYTLFGNTATKLLHQCPCPVWLALLGPEPRPRSLLIATDLLPDSENTVRLGISLARALHLEIHILNVVDYPLDHHWSSGDQDALTAKYHAQVRDSARETLRRHLEQLGLVSDAPDLELHVVGRTGVPDLEILNFIREKQIDLLVMGMSTHSGLMDMLTGHAAERLLPEIPCSLLVVKPQASPSPVAAD